MKKILITFIVLFSIFAVSACKTANDFISWDKLITAIPQTITGFELQKSEGENLPKEDPYWSSAQRVFVKGQDHITISILDSNKDSLLLSDFILTKEVNSDIEINRKIKIGPYAGWEKIKNDKVKGKETNVIILVQNRILVRVFATAGVSEEEIQKATTLVDYKGLEGLF